MTLNMGEIVTVTKHDHEGRILEFVKTPIPLVAAEELKAAALIESEQKKDKALLRETKALLASAKSINAKLAAKPADDKPALQEPPALPLIEPARRAALPAPAATCRPPPALATRAVKPKRTIDEFIDEASVVLSAMKACAERDGAQIGKDVMAKWLEPHKDCAAGSRLEISSTVQIDNAARAVLDQLCKQKSFAVRMPEAHDSFLKAFRAGADAAVADFNERKAVRAEKKAVLLGSE